MSQVDYLGLHYCLLLKRPQRAYPWATPGSRPLFVTPPPAAAQPLLLIPPPDPTDAALAALKWGKINSWHAGSILAALPLCQLAARRVSHLRLHHKLVWGGRLLRAAPSAPAARGWVLSGVTDGEEDASPGLCSYRQINGESTNIQRSPSLL